MKKKWYDDSYWHKPYLDLWSIPHTLFGMIAVLLFAYMGSNLATGLIVTVIVAILWELGEIILKISTNEADSNKVSDVVVAGLGYGVVWFLVDATNLSQDMIHLWLYILSSIFFLASIIGWMGYHFWRKKK